MPYTPLHLGAGAMFKTVAGRRFSFMVFGGTQALMDIEPGVRMLAQSTVVHGRSHSIGGALLIGTLAMLIGKPISNRVLSWLRRPFRPVTWQASAWGAYLGAFSHVVLDAFMHVDMQPFWPLVNANPLLHRVSIDALHLACLVMAVVFGLAAWWRCRAAD